MTSCYVRAWRIEAGGSNTLYVPLDLAALLLRCAPPEVVAVARRQLGPSTVSVLLRQHTPVVPT